MKVGIDISNLHTFNQKRGIGYYTENLIEALKRYTDTEVVVIEKKGANLEPLDLIHYPFFDFFKPTLPLTKQLPTVITIHDVIPLKFPKYYPPGIRGKVSHLFQRLVLKKLDAVITDSESSKKDIEKYFKIKNDSIHTVYLACKESFKVIKNRNITNKVKKKYSLPDEFALYVGSVNWNKNLSNIAEACIKTNKHLVLVGADFNKREDLDHPELRSFKNFLKKYENNRLIHFTGFVEDKELVSIYNLATVTLQVSFYEGFGLPILESQACGTPVIIGDNSSMVEVGGNAVIKVSSENVYDIAFAINQIFENQDLRKELAKKGLENVKKFSWEKVAKETLSVYKSVLEKKFL